MVLAYWQSPVSEAKIGQLFGATEFGTPANRVLHLKQWGFKVTYQSANLKELRYWLDKNIPVITLVQTEFLDYWEQSTRHAVVVIGFDTQRVYLHDPAHKVAPQSTSLDGFLAAWLEMDEMVAVITR
jgi:ABC-type bacteriocin/lantibiotic exporter with double-glycine peptidase domain